MPDFIGKQDLLSEIADIASATWAQAPGVAERLRLITDATYELEALASTLIDVAAVNPQHLDVFVRGQAIRARQLAHSMMTLAACQELARGELFDAREQILGRGESPEKATTGAEVDHAA